MPERFTLRKTPTAGAVAGRDRHRPAVRHDGRGGGSFGGMMMTLCGRPIHQAVATASGFGLAIGAAAALGFAFFGWDAPGRPPLSLGYVNVPAAVIMGC